MSGRQRPDVVGHEPGQRLHPLVALERRAAAVRAIHQHGGAPKRCVLGFDPCIPKRDGTAGNVADDRFGMRD
jgi:hypothetical protein